MEIQKNDSRKLLQYTLPFLGNIEVPLFGKSAEIFDFLDRKNQILRLKNLNQLGVISEVIQTAHHSKYEYIYLFLHLIEKLKEIKGEYPVNRTIINDVNGAELLKVWALLLGIGHLNGTFPVEKAVMKYFCQNPKQRNEFYSVIESGPIREYIDQIINNNDQYRFYHTLAFVKLFRLKESKRQAILVKEAAELLFSYCSDSTKECISSLKDLFARLRKYSYVALDSYYTGMANIFNMNTMSRIGEKIGNPHLMELIDSFDSFLINEIYKTPNSMIYENLLYQACCRDIETNRNPLSRIDNLLFSWNDSDMYAVFEKYKKFCGIKKIAYNLSVSIRTNRTNIFDIESEITNIFQKYLPRTKVINDVIADVEKELNSAKSSISVFFRDKFKFKRVGLLPNLIREILAEILRNESSKYSSKESKNRSLLNMRIRKYANEANLVNVLKFILRILFNEKVGKIHLKNKVNRMPVAFYDKKPYFINEMIRFLKIDDHEILTLNQFLLHCIDPVKAKQNRFIILAANVELQRASRFHLGRVIGEIDGIILRLDRKKLYIYLIEAKSGRKQRYGKSYGQLRKIKQYLSLQYRKSGLTKIRKIEKGCRSAYLEIKLS